MTRACLYLFEKSSYSSADFVVPIPEMPRFSTGIPVFRENAAGMV